MDYFHKKFFASSMLFVIRFNDVAAYLHVFTLHSMYLRGLFTAFSVVQGQRWYFLPLGSLPGGHLCTYFISVFQAMWHFTLINLKPISLLPGLKNIKKKIIMKKNLE